MTEKLVNHQSVSLKIKTDRPVLKTPYQVKGVLIKHFLNLKLFQCLMVRIEKNIYIQEYRSKS